MLGSNSKSHRNFDILIPERLIVLSITQVTQVTQVLKSTNISKLYLTYVTSVQKNEFIKDKNLEIWTFFTSL